MVAHKHLNSCSRGSDALYWPPQTHIGKNIHTQAKISTHIKTVTPLPGDLTLSVDLRAMDAHNAHT